MTWQKRGIKVLVVGMLPVLLAVAGCVTTGKPVERPGKELPHLARHEVLGRQTGFEVAMETAPGGPVIRFYGTETVRSREVRQYEKWIYWEIEGEADPSKIRKQYVSGETLERWEPEHVDRRRTGPLADARATINREVATLGKDGAWPASRELLLRQFDALEPGKHLTTILVCQVAGRGEQRLSVPRCELLKAMGVDWRLPKDHSPRGLRLRVETLPAPPRLGASLIVRVRVTNLGSVPAAHVMGRLFSRQAWLDGRAFYFGQIPPGGEGVAERTVQVPPAAPPPDGRVFAEFVMRNPTGWTEKNPEARLAVPVVWTFPAKP